MIHIWKIKGVELDLNLEELLKYEILANIYINDKSPNKSDSILYFRYLDFITNPRGYCVKNGLSKVESHNYAFKNTNLPKDFKFPINNEDIIKFTKEHLQCDVVNELINVSIQALRITIKNLKSYISELNQLEIDDFKKDDKTVDLTNIISKTMSITNSIPDKIKMLEELLAKQEESKTLRGSKPYESSMDGDSEIESFGINER